MNDAQHTVGKRNLPKKEENSDWAMQNNAKAMQTDLRYMQIFSIHMTFSINALIQKHDDFIGP